MMAADGAGAATMEVSSHGLHQHRVDGTEFAVAVFTNLSQDHLDYHADMEEYFRAKARLFTSDLSAAGVVNTDTAAGRRLADGASIPVTTFGVESEADVRASDVRVAPAGVSFRVDGLEIRSRLRGAFSVLNCLGAVVAARGLGVADPAIAAGIAEVAGVPGRMEPVEAGQAFGCLVDYAHTPDSLENVLRAARGLTDGRVIVVFGCGGDRDRSKRPMMGLAATRFADLSVITSDNPRSERPEDIIAEIEEGARRGGGAYSIDADRRAAIRAAVADAGPGDVVVIAGKGHEAGQEFADRTIPFDDRVVARQEIESLSGEAGP
jgi:UDP-N-acetylmuramoyl-L-alanyl-D-glutamate--2,6-diaminopimelate ligase